MTVSGRRRRSETIRKHRSGARNGKNRERFLETMRELKAEELRWRCSPEEFDFRTTAQVEPLKGIVGQDVALKALRTGIEIRKPGYNIFVAGPKTAGRMALVRECLAHGLPKLPPPPDRVYVNNFQAPYRPILLEFPPGRGAAFTDALDDLIADVREKVFQLAQEDGPVSRLTALRNKFERRREKLRASFEKRAKRDGFVVGQVRTHDGVRPDLLYLYGQKPISMAELEELVSKGELPASKLTDIGRNYEARMHEFSRTLVQITKLDNEYAGKLSEFERTKVGKWLRDMPKKLYRAFPQPGVEAYLRQLKDAIVEKVHLFRMRPHDGTPEGEERDRFREFRGNLLFTAGDRKTRRVVFEDHPSLSSLLGFIERPSGDDGGGYSDFLDIRPGSLLEADRGFIVLNFSDLFQSQTLWGVLKNVIRTGSIAIPEPEGSSAPGCGLKPDPIPVDVKVILVGEPYAFDMVYDLDPDFRNSFKIRVDLEPDFPLTRTFLRRKFPAFLSKVCSEEDLLPLNREATAATAEYGVRLAGRTGKFTASLGKIADMIREADLCARRKKKKVIRAADIEEALSHSVERVNAVERRLTEAIVNGSIMIQTKGRRVGQINGLAVYDLGDYAFCRPSRITVETSVGQAGIINIERESGMSGGSHDKGVHILTGYLRSRFAQRRPLSLTASICFEQSYSAIDGDSASSTEVYAILSSLSGLPIRQDIAVTGSVNQKGEIQAIGCVNEKIEGFYDVVKAGRRTGREGVIIPFNNVPELMLRPDIVRDVRRGKFHIWPVKTVEEGIEILTGVKAGKRRKNGTWTPGSVFDRVDKRLEELVRGLKSYEAAEGK